MNMEASPAPGDGHGIETPSHWIEDAIPEDAVCEIGGERIALRDHPGLREFRSPADMARSLLHARALVGRKTIGLIPLSEDATDEDRLGFDAELRRVVGVPDTPDGYELTMPEGTEPDPEFVGWFRGAAHELGLSPAQAQGLADRYNALVGGHLDAEARREDERRAKGRERLTALWGARAEENAAIARRGFERSAQAAGLDAEATCAFLDRHGDEVEVLRIFHKVGMAFREDSLAGGDGGPRSARDGMSTERFFAEEVFGGKGA
ncbi:hypothetical protein GGQ74_002199 [Desulfobaculum xiamenense]|uniref:Uncharacterized protein n=1 Tax=Desulfobaculum xiamenense TaxID=995050 RepID=A0A846QI49_9BACT|nr:hypothetical protein [Desulfobaculum xiamenense]NJB68526.1 hypothetical protein [Desulfobaculum xiamenense]